MTLVWAVAHITRQRRTCIRLTLMEGCIDSRGALDGSGRDLSAELANAPRDRGGVERHSHCGLPRWERPVTHDSLLFSILAPTHEFLSPLRRPSRAAHSARRSPAS